MKLLVLLAGVVVAASAASFFGPQIEEWTQYKIKFNKKYDSEDEDQSRMKIFLENKKMIEEHNARYERGEVTWEMGINQFTDWFEEEIKAYLSGLKAPSREEFEDNAQVFTPSDDPVPDEIDWRTAGAVTSVKAQGYCRSSWAYSAVGAMEAQHFIKTQKLIGLSEQNLIDCSIDWGNNGCHGGWMHYAFKYVIDNHGIDTRGFYPNNHRDRDCRFRAVGVGANITSYTTVLNGDEEDLKRGVAQKGPFSVAIYIDKSFFSYRGGVYVNPLCDNSPIHGALVVGYGTDRKKKIDYWIVKNCFGKEWGEDGYMRMARNHKNMCGVASWASCPIP